MNILSKDSWPLLITPNIFPGLPWQCSSLFLHISTSSPDPLLVSSCQMTKASSSFFDRMESVEQRWFHHHQHQCLPPPQINLIRAVYFNSTGRGRYAVIDVMSRPFQLFAILLGIQTCWDHFMLWSFALICAESVTSILPSHS